jgi:hypothetical protein
VPFLRRSLDGRWQVGRAEPDPAEPVDPEARVVAAPDRGALRR